MTIVDYIKDAKVGDTVWLFDRDANKYDENRKYVGRGAWRQCEVTGLTRQSLIVYQSKFDIKDGSPRSHNGFVPGYSIYGQKEYEAKLWKDKNHYPLERAIGGVTDIDILKQIAALIGFEEK